VKLDATEPTVIGLFGIAPVQFELIDPEGPPWRQVRGSDAPLDDIPKIFLDQDGSAIGQLCCLDFGFSPVARKLPTGQSKTSHISAGE
jgi:hypothetical protein